MLNQKTEHFHDTAWAEVVSGIWWHICSGQSQSHPAILSDGLLLAVNHCVPAAALVSLWSGRLEKFYPAQKQPLEETKQECLLSSLLHCLPGKKALPAWDCEVRRKA